MADIIQLNQEEIKSQLGDLVKQYVSSKRWQVFPTEKEDILCIVKFFTFSAGLDRLQLTC